MAKTREKDSVTTPGYQQLIEDSFFHPQSAFDIFTRKSNLGERDLLRIYFILSITAPVFTFLRNCISVANEILIQKELFVWKDLTSGVISSWFIFLVIAFLIRFMDIFRLNYKFWDRTKEFDPPAPWIFMVSFIPFMGSGIFLILPTPLNFFMVVLAFFYSLQLSYYGMKNLSGYGSSDFFRLLLMMGIFFLSITSIALLFYNVFRMVQS